MKNVSIIKYLFSFLFAIGGFVPILLKLYSGTLSAWEFLIALLAIGIFIIMFFNFDNVKILRMKSKLLSIVLDIKNEVEEYKRQLAETKKDLELYAKEEISVTDGPPKIDVVVKPNVLKLEARLNRIEDLTQQAEKLLAGKAEGKSNAKAELTKIKKK